MLKRVEIVLQPLLVPPRIAGLPKKDSPLIVVDAVDLPAAGVEERADFRTDQARGTSNKERLHAMAI
jgi:hypothetical protein